MSIRKRILAAAVAAGVALGAFIPVTAESQSDIIYETSARQTITQGVTDEHIVRFTQEGWQNIHILRVDLSNPYIKVDTLTSQESLGNLVSTRKLASLNGAIAAVNASFFTPIGSGRAAPDGPVVKDGELITASSEFNRYNDSMGSFSLTQLNQVLLDYWKTSMTLIAPNGSTKAVARYNKSGASKKYADITVMDRKWSPTSVGVSEQYPDIVEMVVVDGKVSQILASQPAVEIPQNGYLVIARGDNGKFLQENFLVGDPVVLDIQTTPDFNDLKMSVAGGSILVKDGQIPAKFSFDIPYISKRNPRTAVGSSKDGKQLILVTVDGRQTKSIGMTQPEIAKFMLDMGAYNALNLDGGGSTTMAARKPGTTTIETVNSPSDGVSRGVANAIGIFSIAPPSELAGLIIDTEDINMFIHTTRSFTVRGYDKFFNPIEVKPNDIKWSISGLKGKFTGNVFKAESFGEGKVVAKVGKVTASLPISSLSAPVQLVLSDNLVKLPIGKSASFTLTGINRNGYKAPIRPEDAKWAVKGKLGTVEAGKFTAAVRGAGYISASIGNTHAYCAASVTAETSVVKDKFEAANGTFSSYPAEIGGGYEISTEQKHSGKASGKLTYDFSNTEIESRAAYLNLGESGLALEAGSFKLGLWVHNDHENSNWLRAEVTDAKGEKQLVDLAKTMDWTGWKYVEGTLEGIELPAKLKRVYLVQTNPVAEAGSVYLDDLTIVNNGYPAIDPTKIPKDTVPVDEANKSVSFGKPSATAFRFAVFGQSRQPDNPLEKLLLSNLAKKIDKYLEMGIIVGSGSHEDAVKMVKKKKTLATHTVDLKSTKSADELYKFEAFNNSGFFKLNMKNGGLRVSESGQWQQFLQDLNGFKGTHAFILLESAPSAFKDSMEGNLLKETLTAYRKKTKKTVWVFFKGSRNESYMERGVKYLSSAGYDIEGLTPKTAKTATYLLVTVKGADVTYQFRSIN